MYQINRLKTSTILFEQNSNMGKNCEYVVAKEHVQFLYRHHCLKH